VALGGVARHLRRRRREAPKKKSGCGCQTAIASRGDTDIGGVADEVVLIPDVALELQPIVSVVPLQMLSYYVADFKGTDIDQPRNLAKSVTVE
jgi:glucosamine 6-phosphate synthetase-like amidotransferase/phosphosugar isomerase protein